MTNKLEKGGDNETYRRLFYLTVFLFIIAVGGASFVFRASGEKDLCKVSLSARNELKRLNELLAQKEHEIELLKTSNKEALAPETLAVRREKSTNASSESSSSIDAPAITAELAEKDFRVRAKISAIEKFVPLNDEQKERLAAKYRAPAGQEQESLESVIGEENARYYRTEMERSFVRAQEEEDEKEVLFFSRKLNLNQAQEEQLRSAIKNLSQDAPFPSETGKSNSHVENRLRSIIQEEKRREEALNTQVSTIFTPEQFKAYLEYKANSPTGDFQVWHEMPSSKESQ